jgi:transcription elongation factor GreA
MIRDRGNSLAAPAPQQKPLTSIGIDIYRDEFQAKQIERQYWVKEKEKAACLGDRSENAEYISAKEMIRNLDKRLRFLQNLLRTARVIDPNTIPNNDVRFGKKIHFNNGTFLVMVGSLELSLFHDSISNSSPVGKSLLGKRAGEAIFINSQELEIVKIESISKADAITKDSYKIDL